jgi:hypothetical protein
MADDLCTGDLILVHETPSHWLLALLDGLICWFTGSRYSHAALAVRDPPFAPAGLYVWESGWEGQPDPQDGIIKLGVQLTRWSDFVQNTEGDLYVRRRGPGAGITSAQLAKLHIQVYRKPYDMNPVDWILATEHLDLCPQKTSRFWCSAFVAYLLVELGTLPGAVDWSVVWPQDLSSTSTELHFLHQYEPDALL